MSRMITIPHDNHLFLHDDHYNIPYMISTLYAHYYNSQYTFFLFHIFIKTPSRAKENCPYEAISSESFSIINLTPKFRDCAQLK